MKPPLQLSEWFSGLPNKLTAARVAAIPVLILLFMFNFEFMRFIGAFVFLAAAFTDFFDGFFARKYQMQSEAGALLDPIADKMLVLTGMILILAPPTTNLMLPALAIILLGREFAISGLRLIALERHYNIRVNQFGKVKTGFQVAGIFGLMLNRSYFDIPFKNLGMICLWIATILSLYSAYLYWQEFKKNISSPI